MTENVDLKELERNAYRSTFQDGLWDIYIGMLFIGWSLRYFGIIFSSIIGLTIIFFYYTITFLIFFIGKKFIVVPRMGFVKFGPKRKADKRKLIIFASINTLILLVFFLLTIAGIFQNIQIDVIIFPIFIGVCFIWLPLSVVAYFLKYNRLFLYSLIGGLSFILSELLYPFLGFPLNDFLLFGISGGVIIIIGIVYFILFLKKYPLSKKEEISQI
ncbi:MAG: hypothetical protein ACFE85_17385 [Candidatus Hodarchaeota archaeon]